jgi:antitoxin (DNA-binding transcriptional repressor) of toxin-antitoxin stability system
MSTPTIEIGGSQEKLAEVLRTSDQTVTLTNDGQPVGTFIPAHQKTKEEAWESFKRHSDAVQAQMAELGLTEEDMMAEYWRLHDERKAQGRAKS